MSEWVPTGRGIGREIGRITIEDDHGIGAENTPTPDYIAVRRRDDGLVILDAEYLAPLSPDELAALRELLGRAAMPGQADVEPRDCMASHCPPSMHEDCQWPKCSQERYIELEAEHNAAADLPEYRHE